MKKNNRGFAISSMMYSILLLFLMLVLGVFGILGSRKMILDKLKNEIMTDLLKKKSYEFNFDYQNILLANVSKVNNFSFSLLDGVRVLDQNNNLIETPIDVTSDPAFDATQNGVYKIKYTATYEQYYLEADRIIEVVDPIVFEYAYTGKEQQFKAPANGLYSVELWGAEGGSGYSTYLNSGPSKGGNGAYTAGLLALPLNTQLYITVGGKGTDSATDKSAIGVVAGGYNGGGSGRSWENGNSYVHNGAGGGGATHLSLSPGLLNTLENAKENILMVSAGGGGGGGHEGLDIGGAAGGLTGTAGFQSSWEKNEGGTQTAGGIAGTGQYGKGENGFFGKGGNSYTSGAGGGGGAGYYGGAGGNWNAGGGGSSYINGYSGCLIQNDYFVVMSPVMRSGTEEIIAPDGTTKVGNSGNGYAKITSLIVENSKVATNLIKNSSFEGTTDWALSNTSIVDTVSKSGNHALQFQPNTTAMSTQAMETPIADHIYYGSIEFLSSETYTVSDNRFEWYLTDSANSLLVFARKGNKATEWTKLSSTQSLSAPVSGSWKIRNFLVNANEPAYVDNAFIIDLTAIYGVGNEPPKEWCDANISYFNGVGIVPTY